MIYQLVVPGPIEDVDETRVLEWHTAEGEALVRGELLVELETSKAVIELRNRQAGFLRRVLRQPGEWQRIGETLALVSDSPEEPLPADGFSALTRLEFDFWIT